MATIVTTSGKSAPLTTTEMDANFTNLNTDKLEDSASDGSQYARRDGAWVELGGTLVETSSTKPSSPNDGDVWFAESNGVSYVYDSASGDWVAVGSSNTNGINTLAGASDVYLNDLGHGYILAYDNYLYSTAASQDKFRSTPPNDFRNGGTYSFSLGRVFRSTDMPSVTGYWTRLSTWDDTDTDTFVLAYGIYLVRLRVELEQTTSGSSFISARLSKRQSSLNYATVTNGQMNVKGGQKISSDLSLLVNCSGSGAGSLAYFRVEAFRQTGTDGNINASLSAVKLAENFQ